MFLLSQSTNIQTWITYYCYFCKVRFLHRDRFYFNLIYLDWFLYDYFMNERNFSKTCFKLYTGETRLFELSFYCLCVYLFRIFVSVTIRTTAPTTVDYPGFARPSQIRLYPSSQTRLDFIPPVI